MHLSSRGGRIDCICSHWGENRSETCHRGINEMWQHCLRPSWQQTWCICHNPTYRLPVRLNREVVTFLASNALPWKWLGNVRLSQHWAHLENVPPRPASKKRIFHAQTMADVEVWYKPLEDIVTCVAARLFTVTGCSVLCLVLSVTWLRKVSMSSPSV